MDDFAILYVEEHRGWMVFRNGKPWGIFAYYTEWEAIDELKEEYPVIGRALEQFHLEV